LSAALALDMLAAPASEAFVKRIFSACGYLAQGRWNRSQQTLERKVFLKLSWKFIL